MSNRLREIVKIVQLKKKWTLEQVAKSISYSRVHLGRLMKADAYHEVEDILAKKYADLLQNATLPAQQNIIIPTEGSTEKDFLLQKATTKALFQQVAKITAKVFDRPFEDCLAELEQNTILILKDLQESRQ